MMESSDLRVFARIASLGSISKAARALEMPKSSVSRSLARLEQAAGVPLVERSTRHVRLTEAGRLLLPYAGRILRDLEDAGETLGSFAGVPRGSLTVRSPYTFALGLLAPMLPEFLARYPEVEVVLQLDDAKRDTDDGEADLLVKVGPLPEVAMVARRVTTIELWTCASPRYLDARGTPRDAAALAGHEIVGPRAAAVTWAFRDPGGQEHLVELRPRTVVSEPALSVHLLAGGAGIGQLPDYITAAQIRQGRLQRVLPDWQPVTADAHILYASRRSLAAKSRAFIDMLVRHAAAQRIAFLEAV